MNEQPPGLPTDYVIREMSRLAMEKATSFFAEVAETTAKDIRAGRLPPLSAPDALELFARTIRNKNAELYPPKGKPS